MQFPFTIYGMVLYYKRQYTDKTLTLRKHICVCERAERASLENLGIFTFLNCYFFQYFVGTSDTLSVQMTCLSLKCTDKFPNVPTKVRRGIIGEGGGQFSKFSKFPNVPTKVRRGIIGGGPPPPSRYANGL